MNDNTERKELAKTARFHIRALNKVLKKANASGLRVVIKVDGFMEEDGRVWDVGIYGGSGLYDSTFAIAERASHVQVIGVKRVHLSDK